MIFVGVVNQISTLSVFMFIRTRIELIRQQRRIDIWNNDVKISKETISEQYIKDLNY
jgi:hypothetical protein